MKVTKFKEEIQQLAGNKLQEKNDELRRELFSLRLNMLTAHVKDHSQFKKLRKNIARIMTQLQQEKMK